MRNIRTDLALEAREMYQSQIQDKNEVPGVETQVEELDGLVVTRVKITSDEGEKALGKPMGHYVTLEATRMRDNDEELHERISKVFAGELIKIAELHKAKTVLVVGLGNWNITPDALGPKVVSGLLVTRHLLEYEPTFKNSDIRPVCAIAPGVLGITGIETGEVVRGVAERIKPDLVIALDALASRKMERVGTTIQIADTGISPGSGVGNKRAAISEETLGVKVVAIGVPTVVDAATIANDTLDMLLDSMESEATPNSEFYRILKNVDRDQKYEMLLQTLAPKGQQLMVTPKDVDTLIERVAHVLSEGINLAMHGKQEMLQ